MTVTPIEPRQKRPPANFARPIADILEDLSRPLPKRLLKQLEKHNRKTGEVVYLDYIPWYTVARLLDLYAPGWEGRITEMRVVGDRLVLTYALTIHAAEGSFTRTATGNEEMDCGGYGDVSSNAESMAFRRAAAKFGLGLDLYYRD